MNFQIMQHAGGREFIPAMKGNKPLIYDDAKKGAAAAALLTKTKGIKFQLRPMAELLDWRERERNRFKAGEYKPVIWINEKWWKEIDGHFAHIAVKDPTRIAFTPDADKGAADRQTAMLPGKYLQQFFGDVLTADQVRTHAMQHNTTFETNELKFAKTVEEIEAAYKPSLGSCFAGSTKANLFGSGDFWVAYIQDENGKITARALCAHERKFYPKIYGDYHRLEKLLTAAGFKLNGNASGYAGLRLLKKWHWRGFYTDWHPYRNDPVIDPKDGEFLIVQ